jgi:hypothetical protein
MTAAAEDRLQVIGQLALKVASDPVQRLLVYVEAESGAISADVFYTSSVNDAVRFRFATSELQEELYAFWEDWRRADGNEEWQIMCYLIDGGRFSIDMGYPDSIDPDEGLPERRPRAVRKYFGEAKVDYSKP